MTMPNEISAACIIAQGLMSTPSDGENWPLYIGTLPDQSNVESDAGAVFNTAGILHGKDMQGNQYQHYGLQLRIRSKEQDEGYEKTQQIVDNLIVIHNETVVVGTDEFEIQSFIQATDVVLIAVDEKDRSHHTVNLLLSYRQV